MRVFLIAGEASGDALGGALMEGLKALISGVTFDGVGGPMMQAQGLKSRFPMEELSIMGLAEVLPKYFHLKRRIREVANAVTQTQPDVLITIDSPDFCLRVAKLVKDARPDLRTVHYVAPSVWAWRPGRAAKMATVIDHVLALLPFEPPYMEAAGMDCDFVGHPVVAQPQATAAEIAAFRAAHDLGDAPILLILPGSRKGEVTRLAAVFGQALAPVLAEHPDLRVVVPAAGGVADLVREQVAHWPGTPLVLDPRTGSADEAARDKRAAFGAAAAAIAASGTVSLELAAAGTPMVIAYDFNPVTRMMMKRMIRIDTVTLVNLVSDTRVVPECLAGNCRPDRIAAALSGVLADPSAQEAAMALTMERLGQGGEAPGLRAARAVMRGLSPS
ncbi:lipid-A-disaccharide synthase [Chachezhania antarctica]|uniref:lipid-A-disaccharide synthase n=1 Tax=Chachezhania antarctica TaxID=2340860 RepID=UPI000EAD8430|nr:lipid-A-disaccharide synthase [Chachezhania antarctica]|tara:strand:- start:278 stop:1441 length:1164 start_codon:yes stop_codon:yes gene_type:complete